MDILADLTYSRRLSVILKRDGILFLFFRGRDGAVVVAVAGVAGAVRVKAVLARAVTAVKGRFKIGVKVLTFSRTRLLRFA